ncbi:RNA-binding protein 42-like [Mizuhopecten yessoensis]|uniref:RNA-binding protein 42 n=1 Tax=Mizuhopecten yessoensis TaxID=6573 RepID=A0A210R4H7_MIZYE|nr:RNA-binding protein 42-like [Mizuhopecten yessoensis]OWF55950.1 RNA-binding protein 42 [Mizuhopecten yessoensis]
MEDKMAMQMLTDQKLKEMEAEMNRFEQEIFTPDGKGVIAANRMIIGSNTYNKVKARIIRHGDSDEYEPQAAATSQEANIPASVLSAPPPPPPSLLTKNKPSGEAPPIAPPPPPPTLSFVPPQIRNWTPPPPPPRPPMHGMNRPFMGPHGGPRNFGPGPGPYHPVSGHNGPYNGPYNGPPHPPMGMNPHMMPPGGPMGPMGPMVPASSQQETVIEKPKVVYSAAPVRLHPKTGKIKKPKMTTPATTTVIESATETHGKDTADRGGAITTGMIPTDIGMAASSFTTEEECDMMEADIDDSGVGGKKSKKDKKKKFIRTAAGDTWEDPSLDDWESDDFRIFCGDLGNEVTDECLARAFSKYPTFLKAKVVRDKRSNKTKGYGFVSFTDPTDFVRAMREMNGKYVGNRPIKLRKSVWKERNIDVVRRKDREKKRLGLR